MLQYLSLGEFTEKDKFASNNTTTFLQNLGTKIGAVSVFANQLKDLRQRGEEPVRKSCQVGNWARLKFIIKEFAILKRES